MGRDLVEVPAGRYELGEPGETLVHELAGVLIGRWRLPTGAEWEAAAGPFGAEQQAGDVWEWVNDRGVDGWGAVRGGSYLDTAWGVRASRVQPADPEGATNTTGWFRIAIGGR